MKSIAASVLMVPMIFAEDAGAQMDTNGKRRPECQVGQVFSGLDLSFFRRPASRCARPADEAPKGSFGAASWQRGCGFDTQDPDGDRCLAINSV
jgi:hypothetical protein